MQILSSIRPNHMVHICKVFPSTLNQFQFQQSGVQAILTLSCPWDLKMSIEQPCNKMYFSGFICMNTWFRQMMLHLFPKNRFMIAWQILRLLWTIRSGLQLVKARTTDAQRGYSSIPLYMENSLHYTAKIHSHSQIFRYGQSMLCLPHRPNLIYAFIGCP